MTLAELRIQLPGLKSPRVRAEWASRFVRSVLLNDSAVEALVAASVDSDFRRQFSVQMGSLCESLLEQSPLARLGLPQTHDFLGELFLRLQDSLLPSEPMEDNLSQLISDAIRSKSEMEKIRSLPQEVKDWIAQALLESPSGPLIQKHLRSALYSLSIDLCSHSEKFRALTNQSWEPLEQRPEHQILQIASRTYIEQNQRMAGLEAWIGQCETEFHYAESRMREKGVSVELVHTIVSQRRRLARLEEISRIFKASQTSPSALFELGVHICQDFLKQKDHLEFLRIHLSLITKRIIQTNSHAGEHYVTHTWSEAKVMFRSALGGGLLTSMTVFLKFLIAKLSLTGFAKGFAEGLNYAGSFVAIQTMGWTLATKQPSATAPYIAQAMAESTEQARESILALLRAQFTAVFGNLLAVFPVCFGIGWALQKLDHPFFGTQEVWIIQSSTNLLGPSMIFAAFTGLLLFLSSLIAGWFENWVHLRKLDLRFKRLAIVSSGRTQRLFLFLSSAIRKSANPLAANISLGFLLGLTPQFLKFFNLPLEVRHVTLAMGSFAASLPQAFELGVTALSLANSVSGILLIGILNISVSFSLAFALACLSQRTDMREFFGYILWGIKTVLLRPWRLFTPY